MLIYSCVWGWLRPRGREELITVLFELDSTTACFLSYQQLVVFCNFTFVLPHNYHGLISPKSIFKCEEAILWFVHEWLCGRVYSLSVPGLPIVVLFLPRQPLMAQGLESPNMKMSITRFMEALQKQWCTWLKSLQPFFSPTSLSSEIFCMESSSGHCFQPPAKTSVCTLLQAHGRLHPTLQNMLQAMLFFFFFNLPSICPW